MMRVGLRVVFSAWRSRQHETGDRGVVVDASDTDAHVRWTTGQRVGQIDLVRVSELEPEVVDHTVAHHRMRNEHLGFWSDDLAASASSLDEYESWD